MSDVWAEYQKTRRQAARLFTVKLRPRSHAVRSRLRDGPASSLADVFSGTRGLDPLPDVTREAIEALHEIRDRPVGFENPETRYLAGLACVHAIAFKAHASGNADAIRAAIGVLNEMIKDFTRLRDSENGKKARGVPRRERSAADPYIPEVEELLGRRPTWSLKRACEEVAKGCPVSPDALRMAYRRRKKAEQ